MNKLDSVFCETGGAGFNRFLEDCHSALGISLVDDGVVLQKLERAWYASVQAGTPDFTGYDNPHYLMELWGCWIIYSRKYLMAVRDKMSPVLTNIKSVMDLGCGFGYSTAALKEIFPRAKVVGTNFKGGTQWAMASLYARDRDFSLVGSTDDVDGYLDLVFASEYFEHIPDPVDHLEHIIVTRHPRFFVVANSFGAMAYGHFPEYQVGGKNIGREHVGRQFSKMMQEYAYEHVKMGLWNNRPALYRRKI